MSRPEHLRRPVRILHVINDLSIGGAEVMLVNVLARADRSRFEPVVISLMDRGGLRARVEQLGVAVYSPRMTPPLPTPASWLRFFRLVRSVKPDLIQGWMHHASLAAQVARLLGRTRAPVVWNIHGSVYSLAHEKPMTARVIRLGAHLSRLAAAIVFVARTSHDQHGRLGYPGEKSVVFPNGIDTTEFVPSAAVRGALRAQIGVPEAALLVGHVGRYHPVKDHANLLNAFAGLRRRHPDAHLLLAGRDLRPDNAALTSLSSTLGLGDAVHFIGERDDVKRVAASLDVFVLCSSHGEGLPLSIGEAMACEVPCVVTDVGDAAYMVGDTGRVVPPSDLAALTGAMASLADLGPSGRAALGRAARRRVIEHFSIAPAVDRYEQLYARLLDLGRQPEGNP